MLPPPLLEGGDGSEVDGQWWQGEIVRIRGRREREARGQLVGLTKKKWLSFKFKFPWAQQKKHGAHLEFLISRGQLSWWWTHQLNIGWTPRPVYDLDFDVFGEKPSTVSIFSFLSLQTKATLSILFFIGWQRSSLMLTILHAALGVGSPQDSKSLGFSWGSNLNPIRIRASRVLGCVDLADQVPYK